MRNERFEAGMQKLLEIDGDAGKNVYERLTNVSPFMARYLVESFGELCAIPAISNREREIAVIGALTVLGYALPQLKVHVHAGLNAGLTRDEIIAVINTMAAYAGFPATLNALYAAEEVFSERGHA
jgi:4-carboxymuconolactone decarboxylase